MTFPWQQALGFGFQFPATEGERPQQTPEVVENPRYARSLAQLPTVDLTVAEAVQLASQMFDRSRLRSPELVAEVEACGSAGGAAGTIRGTLTTADYSVRRVGDFRVDEPCGISRSVRLVVACRDRCH
jgi:hypothetical protein